ncbi:methylated-DNA--[protein]-cysteine S-methyltransferase [Flavobacterium sp. JP2137]|uniref:methylated-DNA--[protein]-cysteine S-methyltransferase n=1 Tax=Flavobacterium sp. JP2137 TaxID=3414510 RepID=UPI003D301280
MIYATLMDTDFGTLYLQADDCGLTQIRMATPADKPTSATSVFIAQAQSQLQAYLLGQRQTFELTLNPVGTDFQRSVWRELQRIPFGKTISYLELSKRLGNVKAIRAAASANGKNPILIVIPCHRVVGKEGALVGFSAGLHVKKALLAIESPAPQQSLF